MIKLRPKALLRNLQRDQVEDLLQPWRHVAQSPRPRNGWLKAVREALGMTTRQVAARMKVNQSVVVRIEKAELNGTVSLKSLQEAANALGCRFVYAVVPKNTLQQTIQDRAEKRARAMVQRVLHTMALEDQSPEKRSEEALIQARVRELLEGPPSRLWDEISL